MWVRLNNKTKWLQEELGDRFYKVLDSNWQKYQIDKFRFDDSYAWYNKDLFEIYYSIFEVYSQSNGTEFEVICKDGHMSLTNAVLKNDEFDRVQLYWVDSGKRVSLNENIINSKFITV